MYPIQPKDKSVITVYGVYPKTPSLDALGLSGKQHGNRNAVDIAPRVGCEELIFSVVAPFDGVIIERGQAPERGIYLTLLYVDGKMKALFYHLDRAYAMMGQHIKKGQIIGIMGNTGKSTRKHTHFEIRDGLPIKEILT